MTEVFLLGRWRFQPESLFSAGSVRSASGDGWNLVGALAHKACVLSNGVRIRDTQRVSHPLKLILRERGAEIERFSGQRAPG